MWAGDKVGKGLCKYVVPGMGFQCVPQGGFLFAAKGIQLGK